jgi:hypothetical protein
MTTIPIGSMVKATNGKWYKVSGGPVTWWGPQRYVCSRYSEEEWRLEVVGILPAAIVEVAVHGHGKE